MALLTLALLATSVASAVDAPITAVTVYSDRARVVRSVTMAVNGREKIDLPLLPETVDPSSIRMEAVQGEVERVDITYVSQEDYPAGEAQKLLAALEAVDDKIATGVGERAAYAAPLEVIQKLSPQMPAADPLRPPPRLNPAGWAGALGFARSYGARMQQRIRELDRRLTLLGKERATLAEKARLVGGATRRSGHRVTATVSGKGSAKVRLVYMVRNARWYPGYDLQLTPSTGQVSVQFGGSVSQETGEDWVDAALTLSTAIPATATQFPKITTWKIGERERFMPTPYARLPPTPPPPPSVQNPGGGKAGTEDLLKARLLQLSARTQVDGHLAQGEPESINGDKDRDAIPDTGEQVRDSENQNNRKITAGPTPALEAPASTAPSRPRPPSPQTVRGEYTVRVAPGATDDEAGLSFKGATKAENKYVVSGMNAESGRVSQLSKKAGPQPTESVGLLPPPGYTRPSYAADLPVSQAGGWDMSFGAVSKETVRSGKGTRKVALFAKTWPVSVERKVYPALAPDAYLVAELKNPSTQALPGGKAHLFVGADPAGEATLKMVAPGESFTLPLGLDRAIRPIRNVKLVTTEKGVISKDEINRYEVTIELSNPYRTPLPIRVIDQIPVTDEKEVDVQLITASPGATSWDKVKGWLEWRIDVPASGKAKVSFTYSIKRPKGWRLHQ